MIKEYALDPALLHNWERVRYYCEKFGYEHGRLIAKYPKHWKRMVWDSVKSARDVERKKVEEFLVRMDNRLNSKTRVYDGQQAWHSNAVAAHMSDPFAAIITDGCFGSCEVVIRNDDFSDEHPLLFIPKQRKIPRNPRDLAEFLSPALMRSTWVMLIDPHFQPEPDTYTSSLRMRPTRWHLPLVAIMKRISPSCRLDCHAAFPTGADHDRTIRAWERSCLTNLPRVLPTARRLTVHRWQVRPGGAQFHARYIVTEVCAMQIDPGLDADLHMRGQTFDINFLSDQEKVRYASHFSDEGPYDRVSRHEVVGTGEFLPNAILDSL